MSVPWPVSREYITAAEKELGVRFPPAFIAVMLRRNGGTVMVGDEPFELHPFWDQSDERRTSRTCNDIVRETKTMREVDWFPADGVAVAMNASGDCLVLRAGASGAELGSEVFLWELHGGALTKVADNPFELWERPA